MSNDAESNTITPIKLIIALAGCAFSAAIYTLVHALIIQATDYDKIANIYYGWSFALFSIMFVALSIRLLRGDVKFARSVPVQPETITPPVTERPAPEDPEIVKARAIAEIEMQKAEHMARLRLAEAQGLAGIAADVAEKEEARQDRQLDKLTKI